MGVPVRTKKLARWMVIVLWAAPLGVIADDWQTFTSEDSAFTAQMPGTPDNVGGVYIWAKPNAQGTGNDIRYKIYYHEPSADALKPTDRSGQALLAAIVLDDDPTDYYNLSVTKTPFKFKGRPALLIDKPLNPDGVPGRSDTLYILAGQGVFIMSYFATEANFRRDYANKFFESIKIHNPYSDPDAPTASPALPGTIGTPVAVPTTPE